MKLPKCSHKAVTLFKSSSPDFVGSVTISTESAPVMDDITAQPMPGEPSIIVSFPSLLNYWHLLITYYSYFLLLSNANNKIIFIHNLTFFI